MIAVPSFADLAGYDDWCLKNMREWNRLAVTDPKEWEKIARQIETLLERIKRAEAA